MGAINVTCLWSWYQRHLAWYWRAIRMLFYSCNGCCWFFCQSLAYAGTDGRTSGESMQWLCLHQEALGDAHHPAGLTGHPHPSKHLVEHDPYLSKSLWHHHMMICISFVHYYIQQCGIQYDSPYSTTTAFCPAFSPMLMGNTLFNSHASETSELFTTGV